MGNLILVKNEKKYGGQYVATRTFQDNRVVASGASADVVYEAAKASGVEDPVVFYVPEAGMTQIY